MTIRQIAIDWAILDALDQQLGILENQIAATQQTLIDVGSAANEIRGQLQRAYELGAQATEPTLDMDLSAPEREKVTITTQDVGELNLAEEASHDESPVEVSTGAASDTPPGPEGPATPGREEQGRKRRAPRRRKTQS